MLIRFRVFWRIYLSNRDSSLAWEASTLPLSYTRKANLHVNITAKRMEKQVVDRLTIKNLFSTTSLESLAKGCILNCRSEGKSPRTIAIYETVLKNFIWYCKCQQLCPRTHPTVNLMVIDEL